MVLPWRRIRPILLASQNTANLTPRIRARTCCECVSKPIAHARPASRHRAGWLPRRLAASGRFYSTATGESPAQSTVISWTSIAKEEEERRKQVLEAQKNGYRHDAIAQSTDVRAPTQSDILIESFSHEPLVPRPPNLSVLVTPAVKYENYRETTRSKFLHSKSVRRQARLEVIRQAQLMPLPDWRAVLRQLVGRTPRQDDLMGLGLNGAGAMLSGLSLSSPSSRTLGRATKASSLAQLCSPDPLKEQLLQQLPPGASANEYHRHAMLFALPENSPSVESLLNGVDETLWAIARRTGCVLRLYRRGSDEANETGQNVSTDKPHRPWVLTLSGTIASISRAADEVMGFAKDAVQVAIGSDVRLRDRFQRDPEAASATTSATQPNSHSALPRAGNGEDASPVTHVATPMSTWDLVSSSYYLRDRRRRTDAVFSPHTIEIGAHQIPRPDHDTPWTPVSLERYVAALVNGRPPKHLAPKLYPEDSNWVRRNTDQTIEDDIRAGADNDAAGPPVDEDNPVRNSHDRTVVNLLLGLFYEKGAQHALSMSAFKMALEFMCKHGEMYRPEARSLFERASMVQLPMDMETFNILLASQLKTQDLRNFGTTLKLMERYGMQPDLTTWLLFLRLFESEEVKRHILRTMNASRRDLLDLPDALGAIAQELVEYDAQRAVFQRKQQQQQEQQQQNTEGESQTQLTQDHEASIFIDEFIARQTERYGTGWLSRTSANRIVEVFGSYGLFAECLQLLSILRQQQLRQARKEHFREHQQQSQQEPQPLDPEQSDSPTTSVDIETIDTITYNIVLTHAKLHNSLPKAMAVVRHMEGVETPVSSGPSVAVDIVSSVPAVAVDMAPSSPRRPRVTISVAPNDETFQMLFEMAYRRRLPHLFGALWAYASVMRKTTHNMHKRAGTVLARQDPPNKTPLVRALRVGQTSDVNTGPSSPIPLGNAASERIAARHYGWEPAVSLSQVMQEAQDRDKMLLQDRLDRNGLSNVGRPLPPPLRIPLKRKLGAKSNNAADDQAGVSYIEVQADWMLPIEAAALPHEATATSGATESTRKSVSA